MAYIGSGLTRFNTADDLTVTDDAEIQGELSVDGAVDLNTSLNVDGTVTADGLTVDSDSNGGATIQGGSSRGLVVHRNDGTGSQSAGIQIKNNDREWTFFANNDFLSVFDDTANKTHFKVETGGDISFYEDTGTTPKLFWDASLERLGIGTTSPADELDVNGDIRTSIGSGGRLIVHETDSTRQNQLRVGADADGAYLDSSWNTGGSGVLRFLRAGTERMRIDSSGNLLVNCTSPNSQGTAVSGGVLLQVAGDVVPNQDAGTGTGASDIGDPSFRWEDGYVRDGITTGSDGRDKQDIEELSEAEHRVAVVCKGLLRKWRWKDRVAVKGDDARIHFGIVAQDLQAAFEAEGLDAHRYAMLMYNEWWETYTDVPAVEAQDAVYETVTDEEGNETQVLVSEAVEAKEAYTRTDRYKTEEEAPEGAVKKSRMGVRYSELLAFIIAAI